MGCGTCSVGKKDGEPAGCKSNGSCSTGGCNRLNTYDWLTDLSSFGEQDSFRIVEVSFKNGSRKGFFTNDLNAVVITGETVVVESNFGCDVGVVSLSGELVRLQMRKKRIKEDSDKVSKLLRIARPEDIDKANFYREQEHDIMVLSRVIARDMKLNMKIGDIEYQADGRKIIFYYTSNERVDFRELIKVYAKEFRARIEMCQIGPRHEAGKIGGIGSCGRELCCSTWLTKFKTVRTSIARYQHLSINQSKLSGQCGRLKCCLNYELDVYLDALKEFPERVESLKVKGGYARQVKVDIFKRKMWYAMPKSPLVELSVDRVKEIKAMNEKGEFPETLVDKNKMIAEKFIKDKNSDPTYDSVEQIDLPDLQKRKKRNNKRKPRTSGRPQNQSRGRQQNKPGNKSNPKDNNSNKSNTRNQSTKDRKPNPNKNQSTKDRKPNPNKNQSTKDRKPNPNKNQSTKDKNPNIKNKVSNKDKQLVKPTDSQKSNEKNTSNTNKPNNRRNKPRNTKPNDPNKQNKLENKKPTSTDKNTDKKGPVNQKNKPKADIKPPSKPRDKRENKNENDDKK